MVLRLETQLADDFPLLCGCEETGATSWSTDCASWRPRVTSRRTSLADVTAW